MRLWLIIKKHYVNTVMIVKLVRTFALSNVIEIPKGVKIIRYNPNGLESIWTKENIDVPNVILDEMIKSTLRFSYNDVLMNYGEIKRFYHYPRLIIKTTIIFYNRVSKFI